MLSTQPASGRLRKKLCQRQSSSTEGSRKSGSVVRANGQTADSRQQAPQGRRRSGHAGIRGRSTQSTRVHDTTFHNKISLAVSRKPNRPNPPRRPGVHGGKLNCDSNSLAGRAKVRVKLEKMGGHDPAPDGRMLRHAANDAGGGSSRVDSGHGYSRPLKLRLEICKD